MHLALDHALPSFWMIAAVYSLVEALPPRSPVMLLPSAIVCEYDLTNIHVCTDYWTYREGSLFNFICMPSQVHMPKEEFCMTIQGRGVTMTTCLSIIKDDNRSAVGLARPFPAMAKMVSQKKRLHRKYYWPAISGAEPWTASKIEASWSDT